MGAFTMRQMKTYLAMATCAGFLSLDLSGLAATLHVDLNSLSPTAPFADWSTAATNIQDAIDAATDGDLVLVTNGVYATGGKVKFGDLTNRVALDKAITVQSVNGPWVTTIRGAGATNGTSAVRCAWLTNSATLQGFTLTAGATRVSGDSTNLLSGGGVLCLNTNALIKNCVVVSNVAQGYGGGVFQGLVVNSGIIGNRAQTTGSGAAFATLLNCTVVSNWTGVATIQSRHTNSIVYYNSSGNSAGGTFAFSCTTPSASGVSNIITAPQLFSDSIHLMSTSPCRAAGTNSTVGTDIDGQNWADPPSIGCDQWREPPILITQPRIQMTNDPIGFTVSVTAAGQEPFICFWTRNGFPVEDDGRFSFVHTTNLVAAGIGEWSEGSYQVVISNAFGVVTSGVAQMVFHYVNGGNGTPLPPFTSWSSAATNIQDAIDVAAAGEVVLVTNGIYRSGGRVMAGDLTNRVALNKAIIVQSVNGPAATIIEGNWNPTVTNGPAAVRCAWLTNGAGLNGFTLRGGATRAYSAVGNPQIFAGGVWASSTAAIVTNCWITTNTSAFLAGGAYSGNLIMCLLKGNRAGAEFSVSGGVGGQGGGAAYSNLRNCIVQGNAADRDRGGGVTFCSLVNCALIENSSYFDGGAAYNSQLLNCTVTRNTSSGYSSGYGGTVHSSTLTNCLVWGNFSRTSYPNTNYASSTLAYCLSSPLAAGVGNISVDPLILDDGVHLTEFSPCRAAGANVAIAADIDGQAWANPPSIGCDEWQAVPVIGTAPTFQIGVALRSLKFNVIAAGQTPFTYFWLKDGTLIQDNSHYSDSSTANLKVAKFGPEDAGAYQVIVTNAFGAATSQVAQVVIHCVDAAGTGPVIPYSNWPTAANRIQDAIDAAAAGDIVLVTNGVYSTGGKVKVTWEALTNRVAIDKPITVMSVNGFGATVIEGAYDPISTNGPLAIRGVWLMDGAVLGGFTVRNGATRGGNSLSYEGQAGGGVWATSPAATIVNCLLTNNAARWYGAGIYNGTLKNSVLIGNIVDGLGAGGGGGAAYADLRNCTITFNYAKLSSGAAGTYNGTVRNSIVFDNYMTLGLQPANYSGSGGFISYSCTYPLPSGAGNISAPPVFVDADFHISAASPCRGAGSSLYASGEDMDGEAWANPPSMGADEVIEANLVGPISLSVNGWQTNTLVGSDHRLIFWTSITGRVSRIDWDFGDEVVIANVGNSSGGHWWTNSGNYTVTSTAYNNDHPGGVSASLDVQVLPVLAPSLQSLPLGPEGFKFAFAAQESARYDVQFATNLTPPVLWQTLQTIYYSPGGTTLIADPAWTNAARFYRVKAQ